MNIAKAKQCLATYERNLPNAIQVQQEVLLSLASAAGPQDCQLLIEDASLGPALAGRDIQTQVWKTNPNFVVYRLQTKLESAGLYSDPLNGLAAATLESTRTGRANRKDGFECGWMFLTPQVL